MPHDANHSSAQGMCSPFVQPQRPRWSIERRDGVVTLICNGEVMDGVGTPEQLLSSMQGQTESLLDAIQRTLVSAIVVDG